MFTRSAGSENEVGIIGEQIGEEEIGGAGAQSRRLPHQKHF